MAHYAANGSLALMEKSPNLQRVVYVVSLFPCWSETFIVREIQALIDAGVDVRIMSLKAPSETLVQPDAAALKERVHYPATSLNAARSVLALALRRPLVMARSVGAVVMDGWRSPSSLAKSLGALWRGLGQVTWLRKFDPDLIHAHWATYPSTVAWAMSKVLDKPFGFTCHAHDIFVEQHLLARKIEDAALPVTISNYNIDWLNAKVTRQAASRMKLIHCGVDMRSSPWQPDGRRPGTILAVGRLDPIKGFDTLLDALGELKARATSFTVRIVGSGPLESALLAQAKRLGIDQYVEFTGVKDQAAVRALMRESELFVLPSQIAHDGNRDGIPVALMEAMASGCAVVSTRVSGIPELVLHEETGLLVDPRESGQLADALQELLADAMLRHRLATNARKRVEHAFDARKEAARLASHMQEALHAA